MVKLEGIIYKTFDHYVVLRGFAPIEDLAKVSHKPASYQRNAIQTHKKDIVNFLSSGEYKYFPEITLACRTENYAEFVNSIGINRDDVNNNHAQFVKGLRVLNERLPYSGYRARHAILSKDTNEDLIRVDGNHRLEPFDNYSDPVWKETNANILELGELIVPYTVIFSEKEFGDKFEAGIFHNINFRQEPLRIEASLKIIYDLDVFDNKEWLGKEYPLAIKLIKYVERMSFKDIPWLCNHHDISIDFFRTSCLRIVQLILSRRSIISSQLMKIIELKEKLTEDNVEKSGEIGKTEANLYTLNQSIIKLQEQLNHENNYIFKSYLKDRADTENRLKNLKQEYNNIDIVIGHYDIIINRYQNFLANSLDVDNICDAINYIRNIYANFNKEKYGNIAFLCALVYYALLDKNQLNSFVKWADSNGINKIIEPDDLFIYSSSNLVDMFEQIYQAKKNEVFVSMQFGDSQSELIYEKIMRAIEMFNKKHNSIQLNIHPIRIDRTIERSTYSIQDKILEAIQSCSLIIADLSSHNINVYHEIGYAMGIAKSNKMLPNMILLYKENTDHNKNNMDVDKFIGFNLRNLSQLRFKDYDQLVEGLLKRLEKHYEV